MTSSLPASAFMNSLRVTICVMSEDMPKQVTEMNMARCLAFIQKCPLKAVP
jgi:hypothetical protein